MSFLNKNDIIGLSRDYNEDPIAGLKIKQMEWKSFNTVLISHNEEMDLNKTFLEQEDHPSMSDIISLVEPFRTYDHNSLPDVNSCLVCGDSENEFNYNSLNSKINGMLDRSFEIPSEVPIINVTPPTPFHSPANENLNYFPSQTEDKSYLLVPSKPTKGDYYGKEYWEECNKITSDMQYSISKQLLVQDERVVELFQDEELKVCNIKRICYTRGASSSFIKLYSKFYYKHNRQFNQKMPYRAEFIRYSYDHKGEINMYSKCGLCPFCPNIVFKNMATFEYNDHLSLHHGITRNSKLIPNPVYFGLYKFINDGLVYYHPGTICSICGVVVKVGNCKSLYNYMRHYRDEHS